MAKRFIPQQEGDRKRAKLDVSITDHNFPLSPKQEPENWGDDKDDEILLMASQACEKAISNNVSVLPDYSMCMQPGSTSTQLDPSPSTSKTEFAFKKPSTSPSSVNLLTTNLREKCNRISAPLPGITAAVTLKPNEIENFSDDLIFNDKICKGEESDSVYKELRKLQAENVKLKLENGKLLEKCVTKEGETSILRTQLKSCQVAVDNARMEKIKAQEKVQMEWTEKLTAANNQMHDIKTQLDFKNMEIISIKDKCKKLESTKVKLTQVTVASNDISSSQRANFHQNESMTQSRRVRRSSNGVQTDDKAHFLALNKTFKPVTSNLTNLLPYILQPTEPPHSLLDNNEKLHTTPYIPYKCRVYSTFHRVPATATVRVERKGNSQLATLYEDIVKIATGTAEKERYFNVFNAAKNILMDVLSRLEAISQKMTTAFQREMDEKYIETTSSVLDVSKEDLLKGRSLYKEEQEILARRMTAILSYMLESSSSVDMLKQFEQSIDSKGYFTECIGQICNLLDYTSTATLHSGLLLAITHAAPSLPPHNQRTLELIRSIITSRPRPAVSRRVLALVRGAALGGREQFCPGNSAGNLKMDYDQGVLLYKKDSCYLQILLKQIEGSLKCIESENLSDSAAETTRDLIGLFNNLNCDSSGLIQDTSRCDCQLVLVQVMVYALRICAVMLQHCNRNSHAPPELLATCRCGVQTLYQATLRDLELSSQLAHNEGHLVEFCEIMRTYDHSEVYGNMLSELAATLQSTPEEMPPSFHRQPWLKSFESFSMAD